MKTIVVFFATNFQESIARRVFDRPQSIRSFPCYKHNRHHNGGKGPGFGIRGCKCTTKYDYKIQLKFPPWMSAVTG